MLDYGPGGNKYKSKINFIKKEDFMIYYIYKKGKLINTFGYGSEIINKISNFLKENNIREYNKIASNNNIIDIIKNLGYCVETDTSEDYFIQINKIDNEERYLLEQWFDDIYDHYNLPRNSKYSEIILNEAWDRGHADGLRNVEYKLIEILDFIDRIEKSKKL